MRSFFLIRLRFPVALLAVGLVWPAAVRAVDLQNLVQSPPFGAVAAAGAAQAPSSLEFRGVFVDRGEYFFSLYETAAKRGLWVGLNEAGNPFTVRNYDVGAETLTVDYQGRPLTLTLKHAKILASAPTLSPQPNPAAGPTPGGPVPATMTGAAPAPEAQIAEEIRRRRAFRQQTAPAPVPGQPGEKPGTPQP